MAITAQPLGILSSLRLMLRGFLGKLGDDPEVSSFAFEELSVVGRRGRRPRVKVATDGEIGFLPTPLVFRPSTHALQLIVPRVHVMQEDGGAAAEARDANGAGRDSRHGTSHDEAAA